MGWNSWRFGFCWFGLCCGMNFSVAFQYQFCLCRSPSLLYWASAPWKVLLERTILWRAWWFQTFFIFQPCSTWVTSSIWKKTRHNSLSWLADSFCCMINPDFSLQTTVLLQHLIRIHNNNLSYCHFRHHSIGIYMPQKGWIQPEYVLLATTLSTKGLHLYQNWHLVDLMSISWIDQIECKTTLHLIGSILSRYHNYLLKFSLFYSAQYRVNPAKLSPFYSHIFLLFRVQWYSQTLWQQYHLRMHKRCELLRYGHCDLFFLYIWLEFLKSK